MHGLELSSQHQSGLPSYRPSPDYDMVMRERAMHAHAYMPEAYQQQQTVRELQNGVQPADPRYDLQLTCGQYVLTYKLFR